MHRIKHHGHIVELPDGKRNEFDSVELAEQAILDLNAHVLSNLDEVAAHLRATPEELKKQVLTGWDVVDADRTEAPEQAVQEPEVRPSEEELQAARIAYLKRRRAELGIAD